MKQIKWFDKFYEDDDNNDTNIQKQLDHFSIRREITYIPINDSRVKYVNMVESNYYEQWHLRCSYHRDFNRLSLENIRLGNTEDSFKES